MKTIDCACVITGDKYDFDYVHKLYNGLTRGFANHSVTLHVYTEESRKVPKPYIKHTLKNFKTRSDKGWWHKLQLFNPDLFNGQLLYFDLDVVVVDGLDWIVDLDTKYFWGIQDFKYLWSNRRRELNSSVMYFNTEKFRYIWNEFNKNKDHWMSRLHGDQNYIWRQIPPATQRYFDVERVKSYKWECLDGGWNNDTRQHRLPGSGTVIPNLTSILIFHGRPNPGEVDDEVIKRFWN